MKLIRRLLLKEFMLKTREATNLFSSKAIKSIANGDLQLIRKVAEHYSVELGQRFLVEDVFNVCFEDFSANYRAEYFFKNIVAERILLGRHSLNTATMISEFRVGVNKADCVLINGKSTCYEIKSGFDRLGRLADQLEGYRAIFDRVYVVTANNHIEEVERIAPDYVGVIELTNNKNLREVRPPQTSTSIFDVREMMRSLRIDEYKEIVRVIFGEIPEVPNTKIFSACEQLLLSAPIEDVKKTFFRVMKKSRAVDKNFALSLPRSLLMAGISYRLSDRQKIAFLKNLKMEFEGV